MSKEQNKFDSLTVLTAEEHRQFQQFEKNVFPDRGVVTTFSGEVTNWLVRKHKTHFEKGWVTPDAWREWIAYEAEKRRAYEAQAEIDIATLPQSDQEAIREQWAREYHGYFDYWPPNTKAAVDRLLQRCEEHRKAERAKLAAEARAKAEELRLNALVAKLKAHVFAPLDLPAPDYEKVSAARKNPEKTKRQLLQRWKEQFKRLPQHIMVAWMAYHTCALPHLVEDQVIDEADSEDGEESANSSSSIGWVYLTPDPERDDIFTGIADQIAAALRDPAFEVFRRFSESIRRVYDMLDGDVDALINPADHAYHPLGLRTLDGQAYQAGAFRKTNTGVLAGVIPKGLTIVYGDPKHGKSAWLQKLGQCVSADRAQFEGLEIEHGPVAYITLDIGAEFGDLQVRALQIRERLGLPHSGNFAVTDDTMFLNEPVSVDEFLKRCPGQFKMIIIDPLYMAAVGSLKSDEVMTEVIKGLRKLARISDAVVLVHHEPRSEAHLYGSMFLEAAYNSKIHVVRTGDNVTVKVEALKNETARKKPFEYRFEGALLVDRHSTQQVEATPSAVAATELHTQILACLPDRPIRAEDARRLIDHLLTGDNPEGRKKQWQRACKSIVKAGLITIAGKGRGTVIRKR